MQLLFGFRAQGSGFRVKGVKNGSIEWEAVCKQMTSANDSLESANDQVNRQNILHPLTCMVPDGNGSRYYLSFLKCKHYHWP